MFRHGVHLSKKMCPNTQEEREKMRNCPYASAVGSLMYAMLCTRPDICYAVSIVSRYQSNPGPEHWTTVKHILKYLNRTKHYFLVFGSEDLNIQGYTDSDFQSDIDDRKSIYGFVFTLRKGAISCRSCKQDTTADSTTKAEYIAASEAAKDYMSGFECKREIVRIICPQNQFYEFYFIIKLFFHIHDY
jgi:hypothetical protein